MLLTADDLTRRSHYRNAQQTVERLLALGALPIVNENDTVATEEIRFGDNDRLAALVAHVARADALVLLSDVDGVYDGDPRTGPGPADRHRARRRPTWPRSPSARPSRNGVGTGGMATKVEAALIAAHAGVPVVVTSTAQAAAALAGERVGTLFTPTGPPSQRPAVLAALRQPPARAGCSSTRARSAPSASGTPRCWPPGITGVAGDFLADDPVELVGPDGVVVARGLVAYDARGAAGRCSAARPATWPRSTAARSCTATRWCWSGAASAALRDCRA